MEKVFIRLYKRKKDETENLRVTINYHHARYFTRYNCDEKFFDKESQLILGGHPSYRTINNVLTRMVMTIEERLAQAPMTEKQFREFCHEQFETESVKKTRRFVEFMDEFIATKTAPKTIASYKFTRQLVEEYQGDADFDSINVKWLLGFEKWMVKRGYMTNGRSIHLRNIRAVFNYCLDCEYTQSYPFRRFTIKTEETVKKAITVKQLQTMMNTECDQNKRQYIDAFLLMFYLRGINASDLFELTEDDVEDGYITYRRKKTGKLYQVKLEKEIEVLLYKYKGDNYLLCWAEHRKADWFMHEMTKCFDKLFGKHITSNSARHTWATMAAGIGIDKDIISASLGHTIGSKTTEIYIKYEDQEKVDKANRKVMNHLLGIVDERLK